MQDNSFILLLHFLLIIQFLVSCTNSISGDDIETQEPSAAMRLEPNLIRTFVGDQDIKIETHIENLSVDTVDTVTNIEWMSNSPEVATVDEKGNVEVLDLGKAFIIAFLTNKDHEIIASDSIALYSEAKLTLETEGKGLRSITKTWDEYGIFIGSAGVPNLYVSDDYGDSWHLHHRSLIGPIHQIERSAANPEYLIARAYKKGTNFMPIFSSIDNGATWREMEHPFDSSNTDERFIELTDLSFNVKNASTLYAVAKITIDTGTDFSEQSIRIYTSHDFGENWENTANLYRSVTGINHSVTFPKIFTDPSNPDRLYLAPKTYLEELYVSNDKGNTWDLLSLNNKIDFHRIGNDGTLFVYSHGVGLVMSNDHGQNWNTVSDENNPKWIYAVDFLDEVTIATIAQQKMSPREGFLVTLFTDYDNAWKYFSLSFNEGKIGANPDGIRLLHINSEYAELLVSWGTSYYDFDFRDQIWKIRWYYNI